MNKSKESSAEIQDEILQAFEETKGEQLELFTEEKEQDIEMSADQPEITETPDVKEEMYKGFDGESYTKEEWLSPVVHNGPTRREVEGWKEKHGGFVYFTPFDGSVFVWRTLSRPEYREIVRDTTLTALDREELFTEKCVLFPYDFSLEKIKKSRAGIASLLSEMIMEKSGFVAQSAPIKL